MVTDANLTNIFVVNGVSHIRYRAYSGTCERSTLLSCLKGQTSSSSPLIQAYHELCQLNIPCTWRVAPRINSREPVPLELFVFWFEDRHTGIIDVNQCLNELEETRMGSFTWDKIVTGKGASNGKPAQHQQQPRARVLVSLPEEYKLFIKSVKNLINRAMLSRGALPLGDFFLTPSATSGDSNGSNLGFSPESASEPSAICTMVGCAYNTYVTGTDLVFRPYTRQLRLRPLACEDMDSYGLKVILSPSGEQACLAACMSEISEQVRDETLRDWAALYNIPIQHLLPTSSTATDPPPPPLVAIRTKTNATSLYPTKLIFVPTSTRQSPARMAGMNGVYSCDRGLTRDIGKDWNRWAWVDGTSKGSMRSQQQDGCRINYWAFGNSNDKILEALAACNPAQEYAVLKRAMEQKLPGGPVVRPKAAVASRRPSVQDDHAVTDAQISNGSLLDYIMRNFSNPADEDTPMTMESVPEDSAASAPYTVTPTDQHPDDTPVISQDLGAADDTFGFGYNNMFAGESRWDNDAEDMDNFDFDVTEADFDFFKSEKKPPAVAAMMDLDRPESVKSTTAAASKVPTVTDTVSTPSTAPVVPDDIKAEHMETSSQPSHPPSQQTSNQQLVQQGADAAFSTSPIASDVSTAALIDAGAATTAADTTDMSICATPELRPQSSQQLTQHIITVKAGYATESLHMIPKDFSAVPFPMSVDDAKYMDGGKFNYKSPSPANESAAVANETAELVSDHQMKPNTYRPDYIPSKILVDKAKRAVDSDNPVDGEHGNDSSSEIESTSTDTSSSEESEDSDASSSDVSLSSHDGDQGDVLERIHSAQMTYVRRLLGDIKNRPKRHRVANLTTDYDSPFPSSVMDSIQPEKMTMDDIASLDQLCQQAVWGGYPFTGELPESMSVCSDGVCAREDITTIITRQTTLIQSIRGDITHVPSLPSTSVHVVQSFKGLLQEVFGQQPPDQIASPVVSDSTGSPSAVLVGGVNVKGPLQVHEYYQLLETTPTQSRYYGKFQVKKRRSKEPDLQPLSPPDIVVGRNDDWLEGSASMVHVWEKIKLEPYSYKNNVLYFTLYPENQELSKAVSTFLSTLSGAYEVCNLGTHTAGRAEPFANGMAAVPLNQNNSWTTAYSETCEKLGTALGMASLQAQDRNTTNIVIYLINPSTQLSSNLALSRAFRTLVSAYTALHKRFGRASIHPRSLVMQIIPAEHILRVGESCAFPVFRDIAFSVYSQCHSVIGRMRKVDSTRSLSTLYTPPWVLAQRIPEIIRLSFKRPLITHPTIIVDPDAMLHMVYSFSLDRRWMIAVWSDHRGELIEFAVLEIQAAAAPGKPLGSPLVKVFAEAWTRTKKLAKRTGFSWQFALAKMGLIFESELQAWEDVLHAAGDNEEKVAILCVDMESPLSIDTLLSSNSSQLSAEELTAQAMDQISERYTYSSVPSPTTTGTDSPHSSGKENSRAKSPGITDPGTQLILLNHRMAYSRQRVNVYQGDLSMEPMNELDRWMLPLASGYLVKQNASEELPISCNQLAILELHLVYNKQNRGARTALREIMKQYNALSYVNHPPSCAGMHASMLPNHLVLVERLSRILLVVGS